MRWIAGSGRLMAESGGFSGPVRRRRPALHAAGHEVPQRCDADHAAVLPARQPLGRPEGCLPPYPVFYGYGYHGGEPTREVRDLSSAVKQSIPFRGQLKCDLFSDLR